MTAVPFYLSGLSMRTANVRFGDSHGTGHILTDISGGRA